MIEAEIGVIGLGRMGGPIAARLAGAGYRVIGFDAAGTAERAAGGVEAGGSVAELFERCDVVALSLPRADISIAVVQEAADLAERRVTDIVDLSTVGLRAAMNCERVADEAGFVYVDAPLSGGVAGAETGKLAMMVAAPAEAVERLRPLLEEIAQKLFVVGTSAGHGQAMKLLNNYVSGTALAATMEAVVFGQRVGLDMEQMVEVLNAASGRTTTSTDKLPRSVLPGTYDFGFATEAMRKDVGLFLTDAGALGSPRRLAEASDAMWQRFQDACPGTDFTYMHKYLEDGGQ